MATSFPTSLDTFTDATANTAISGHGAFHADTGNALENVEAKLGTGSSTPTSGTVLRGNGNTTAYGTGGTKWRRHGPK